MKKAKLRDWFICDDVRQEGNGKLFFIGVYQDNVLIDTLPAILPMLVFYSKWDIKDVLIEKVEFLIRLPNGGKVGPIAYDIPSTKMDTKIGVIQIRMSPFKIETTGPHKIEVKINGIKNDLGSFEVKLKKPSNKDDT